MPAKINQTFGPKVRDALKSCSGINKQIIKFLVNPSSQLNREDNTMTYDDFRRLANSICSAGIYEHPDKDNVHILEVALEQLRFELRQ